jgi:hypothetical protein
VILEAKMFSKLSKGIKNFPEYDQATRNIACIAEILKRSSVYKYFLKDSEGRKNIFISANGVTHPDDIIFDLVNKFNLRPFCTNLANQCLPKNVLHYKPITGIDRVMRDFLIHHANPLPIPCQGNIDLKISKEGVAINSSTGTPCIYEHDTN